MRTENEIQGLRREVGRLSRLLQIGRALSSDLQIENLMGRISEECAMMVGARRTFIFLLDRKTGQLWTVLLPSGKVIKISHGEGIEGWVALNREYVIVDEPRNDSRFSDKLEIELGFRIANLVALPLLNIRGESIGVFEAVNKDEGNFDANDYLLLQAVAAQISMNIENTRLYHDLRQTFDSLTEVMAATIDAKHPITKGHSKRVALYSVGIARELGLSEHEIELIKTASLLHDYGKIGIDDSILKKQGRLSEEEFVAIKEHAKITHDIVSKVHFAENLAEIPTIASCHHERWDGAGYPFGMAREAIPLGSRIIAVADTFDAITSEREYKESKSMNLAVQEILTESGSHFDPTVVEAFARYYRKVLKPLVDKGLVVTEENLEKSGEAII